MPKRWRASPDTIATSSFETTDQDDTFFLGRIVGRDENALQLHTIDHLGQWDSTVSRIAFDQITRIQFGTPYIRLFMKYAPPDPPMA